jgi:ArsR family metal-binding transcriptional regulator
MAERFEDFVQKCQALLTHYGTDNVSETVIKAVNEAYKITHEGS